MDKDEGVYVWSLFVLCAGFVVDDVYLFCGLIAQAGGELAL